MYEQTRREFGVYLPRVRPYGFITLHDTEVAGVIRAVYEVLKANPTCRYYNFSNCHGLGVLRKVPPAPAG